MALTGHQIFLLVLIIIIGSIPIISGILFLYWDKIITFLTKKIYSVKFPHKIICCKIHYPGNKFKRIYRLIPDTKKLGIGSGDYHFTQDNLEVSKDLRDKLVFHDKSKRLCFRYEEDFKGIISEQYTKEEFAKMKAKHNEIYYINEEMISEDQNDYNIPEVDYWFNNPNPIIFDFASERVDVTAKDVRALIESEVVIRLLKLAEQNMQLLILMILAVLAVACSAFSAYTSFQIQDGLKKAGVIAAKSALFYFAIPKIKEMKK